MFKLAFPRLLKRKISKRRSVKRSGHNKRLNVGFGKDLENRESPCELAHVCAVCLFASLEAHDEFCWNGLRGGIQPSKIPNQYQLASFNLQ